jgi:hypothetical protein
MRYGRDYRDLQFREMEEAEDRKKEKINHGKSTSASATFEAVAPPFLFLSPKVPTTGTIFNASLTKHMTSS